MDSPAQPADRRPLFVGAGALFFVAYLVFQAFFALSCFQWDYGCPLTWVMYSGRSPAPSFFVEWKSGGEASLAEIQQTRGVGIVLGGKMDRVRFLPAYLCENLPDARSIRLEFPDGERLENIPCLR